MAEKSFKFISPGVFVNEIDKSQLPADAPATGPVIVGRSLRGPAMVPVTVRSFDEFVQKFGEPVSGLSSDDVWRDGNLMGPTYGAYAMQAWLRNGESATFVRTLGTEHPERTTAGRAGWHAQTLGVDATSSAVGGAYGLFVWPSASAKTHSIMRLSTHHGSVSGGMEPVTGTLAAVWYLPLGGKVTISGTLRKFHSGSNQTKTIGTGDALEKAVTTGTNAMFESEGGVGLNNGFTAEIHNAAGALQKKTRFNFNKNSDLFIRKVFNTNPAKTNTNLYSTTESYWLGESYEEWLREDELITPSLRGSTNWHGCLLGMGNTTFNHAEQRKAFQRARTGWFIAQDLSSNNTAFRAQNMPKLFKLHGRNGGEYDQARYKISVSDIKYSTNPDANPYGSFTVRVRKMQDSDTKIQDVEVFTNCNLNPNSDNYIARRIGDKYVDWDETSRRNIEYGQFANQSDYVRVEMNESLEDSGEPEWLPFGAEGPQRYSKWGLIGDGRIYGTGSAVENAGAATSFKTVTRTTSEAAETAVSVANTPGGVAGGRGGGFFAATTVTYVVDQQTNTALAIGTVPIQGFNDIADFRGSQTQPLTGALMMTATVVFPRLQLRKSTLNVSGALAKPTDGFFGVYTDDENGLFDNSIKDLVRALPDSLDSFSTNTSTEFQYVFSLDDVGPHSGSGNSAPFVQGYSNEHARYQEYLRVEGRSFTAGATFNTICSNPVGARVQSPSSGSSYKNVLDAGFDQFTTVMFGGYDGFDITEKEPLLRTLNDGSSTGDLNSSPYYSVRRALDTVRKPEDAEYNVAAVPGLKNTGLTNYLIEMCEDRGDALAVVDLENDYIPKAESSAAESSRKPVVSTAISSLRNRYINNSYGAAYFPWVQIRDSVSGALVWVPPSVVAIGAMSRTDAVEAPWFAPAGFNRGGLTAGNSGLSVVGVSHKLTSAERDNLYADNINPIASFPSEGIVIFGQKTMQTQASALDRINVRRMLIYAKKTISAVASQLLFEPNVPATWSRFTNNVIPILNDMRSRFGVDDYKLVLDESTTTPDLIDQNTIYAKLLLKPTKAVEFFLIDFVITNSGASFSD